MPFPFLLLPPWTAFCRVQTDYMRVSVIRPDGLELMQARLPIPPAHPRAFLELLEALARHSGHPLNAVISVGARSETFFDEISYADALQLAPSALVRVVHAVSNNRQLRLAPDFTARRPR